MVKIAMERIVNALKGCADPEIGLNIVDLGLIQGINVDENGNVKVKLTMTSPMCPVTSVILADVQLRLEHLEGIGDVDIDLVWDPAWSPEMISDEARMSMNI
ncbi:MAG: iron-sulfur cluster assembly protein [Candidatus Marsarchaeota archaeon]|nr:iron-sulfur cluster assembly protein [Candidatus Marsarchaeota archaeon]MCL5412783.1 iron-sulfur cluster assembly protein [Candidatus Marsarchaeota archaeon]